MKIFKFKCDKFFVRHSTNSNDLKSRVEMVLSMEKSRNTDGNATQ